MPETANLRSLRALGYASVLAPGLLFGGYAWTSYFQAFRDAETRALHLTGIVHEHAHRLFEAIGLALKLADQRLVGRDWHAIRTSRVLWEEMRSIQGAAPQLGSIFVIAPDGSSALTTRNFPSPPVEFSDRDYFIAQRDADRGLFLGRAETGRISRVPIFNLSIRRTSPTGEFDGVVGSSASVEYFRDFYSGIGDPGDRFAIALFREDGYILARHPEFEVGDRFEPSFLHRLKSSGTHIAYAVSPVDGSSRLYATAKVDEFPVYVAYSVEHGSILRRWASALIVPGILAALFTLALSVMLFVALRRAQAERAAVQELRQTAISLEREIESRRRAEASLMHSQRLDAVGQMTGGIAHDFNNLLTVILGNIDLAQRHADSASVQRLIMAARRAADRGAILVSKLLAFSRGQELRPEVVNLNDVVANACALIRRAIDEAIEIEVECDPDLWSAHVDVAEFETALLNLAINSRDAMSGAGTLLLRTRNITVNAGHNYGSLQEGEYVQVSVTDTGSGMSPDVLARAYEPFFTTKQVGKGSGLGLSQVHGFIRQSGGEVHIDSEVGKGTTVSLFLPRSKSVPMARPQVERVATPAAANSNCVVLVVEGDDDIRKLSTAMLDELGYVTLVARSGGEALALLSAGEPVHLLFTERVLPDGMSGRELANRALQIRPDLTVLVTTAAAQTCSDFPVLRKPFTKHELGQAILGAIGSTDRPVHGTPTG